MNNFVTFQKFETRAEAELVATLLEENGVDTFVEQNNTLLDQNIIGQQYDNYILLKINGADFPLAQKILVDNTKVDLAEVDKDYMLLSFSNDELMGVIAKPDEWGVYNYNLAQALLKERNVAIDEGNTELMHAARIAELSQQRELSFYWMIFGYGFSLLAIAARLLNSYHTLLFLYRFYLVPGILGIILGSYIRFTKRTLPDGTRIYSFTDKARKHGIYMMALGVIALIVLIFGGVIMRRTVL